MPENAMRDALIEAAMAEERNRCLEIVGMARGGEIDSDLRTVLHFIRGGTSIESIREAIE